MRRGRALLDQEKKITFSRSNGAIAAVMKTLDFEARRLDAEGNEVLEAYGSGDESEKVVTVSDEQAERVGQEVASDVESVGNEVIKPAEQITLSKSEEAIVNKLRESDDYSFTGTKTDLGTSINYPRTSVRDALKRLEQKGVVQITPNEDGTFEYRLIALL